MAEIISKPECLTSKSLLNFFAIAYCISLLHNSCIFWARKHTKYDPFKLGEINNSKLQNLIKENASTPCCRYSTCCFSHRFAILWKVTHEKVCSQNCGMWPLLQNACSQIQTVSLPTRHVSMHMKSREGYSNGLNWDAFQGLKVMGQLILA